jgi:hypothetical protein
LRNGHNEAVLVGRIQNRLKQYMQLRQFVRSLRVDHADNSVGTHKSPLIKLKQYRYRSVVPGHPHFDFYRNDGKLSME